MRTCDCIVTSRQGDFQKPSRHLDREPGSGYFMDPDGSLSWKDAVPDETCTHTFKDLKIHLEHPVAATKLDEFFAFSATQTLVVKGFNITDTHPTPVTQFTDPYVRRFLSNGITVGNQIKGTMPQLR